MKRVLLKNSIIFFALTVPLALAAFLWWYPLQISPETPEPTGRVIRIARNYWPGQFWKEIAAEKGWFEEAGLKVELVDTNPDYYGSLEAMARGGMESNAFPLFDYVHYCLRGFDLVAVLNTDVSFGIDGIVAREGIETPRDLVGKRVGVVRNTVGEYLLDVVLLEHNIDPEEVIKVGVLSEDAANALLNGGVDAVVTWEPYLSEAVEKTGGRILFDSTEIQGINQSVEVFHRDLVEERPQDVQAYVDVWRRTVEFMRENPGEAFAIIAGIYGSTPGEVEEYARVDRILGPEDNRTSFSYASGFESVHGAGRKVNNFMIRKGMTVLRLDTSEYFDDRFIRGLGTKLAGRGE